MLRSLLRPLTLVVATLAIGGAAHAVSVPVSSNADSGPDTFREAVETANADPAVDRLVFDAGLDDVELLSAVTYSGTQDLHVLGNGTQIEPDDAFMGNLFVSDAGANLDVSGLVFDDAAAQAIFVDVPGSATGTVSLALAGVVVKDSGLHGVHVSDGARSPATMRLDLENVTILSNGLGGASDLDGIRVDETGEGDLIAHLRSTVALFDGGDGIEPDETGNGTVNAKVSDSSFDHNGPQDPGDLEDGFDIDEADAGDLDCIAKNVGASGNFDGGIDLDEAGDGKLVAEVTALSAIGNMADGFKTTEGDAGDSRVLLWKSRISGTTDNDGAELEQFVPGTLMVTVRSTLLTSNDGHAINIDTDGTGVLKLKKNTVLNNDEPQIDVDGGIVIE